MGVLGFCFSVRFILICLGMLGGVSVVWYRVLGVNSRLMVV